MPKLIIDNRAVVVDKGVTILEAAEKLGIKIPTMCFKSGLRASTSCMLCVVRVSGASNLVPACGTVAGEGMRVETGCEEVRQARKAACFSLLQPVAHLIPKDAVL